MPFVPAILLVSSILAITQFQVAQAAPKKKGLSSARKLEQSAPLQYALARLRLAGVRGEFVDSIATGYDESIRDDVVALNVLGFLVKESDYSGHFSTRAVDASVDFLGAEHKSFNKAFLRYGVQPEVIAALLWVETKHGRQLGDKRVSDVYLSLVQADHPQVTEATLRTYSDKVERSTAADRKKVRSRSRDKALWAIEELRALSSLQKKGTLDPKKLKGSFAGAFGLPQFLPSSYKKWAKADTASAKPDLFRREDAILSVAHYLKRHGWKKKGLKAQRQALKKYNRSDGYVKVILKIADCVRERAHPGTRSLAGGSTAADACEK